MYLLKKTSLMLRIKFYNSLFLYRHLYEHHCWSEHSREQCAFQSNHIRNLQQQVYQKTKILVFRKCKVTT